MTNGPSGKGVDDLFTPELAASGEPKCESRGSFDDMKINAVLAKLTERITPAPRISQLPTCSDIAASVQHGQKLGGYTARREALASTVRDAETRGQFHRKVAEGTSRARTGWFHASDYHLQARRVANGSPKAPTYR